MGGSPYQCVLGTPPGGNGVPFTPLAISATPRRFGDPPGMTAPHSPPLYSHRCAVTVGCKSPFWRQCCKQRSASGGAPPPPPPPAPTGSAPSRHCRARPRRTRSDGSAYSFLSVRKETEGLWGDEWSYGVICGAQCGAMGRSVGRWGAVGRSVGLWGAARYSRKWPRLYANHSPKAMSPSSVSSTTTAATTPPTLSSPGGRCGAVRGAGASYTAPYGTHSAHSTP